MFGLQNCTPCFKQPSLPTHSPGLETGKSSPDKIQSSLVPGQGCIPSAPDTTDSLEHVKHHFSFHSPVLHSNTQVWCGFLHPLSKHLVNIWKELINLLLFQVFLPFDSTAILQQLLELCFVGTTSFCSS